MSYEDFVYFILAEEDKSSEPSLEYWYTTLPSLLILVFLYERIPLVLKLQNHDLNTSTEPKPVTYMD